MRERQITVVARLARACAAHAGFAEDQRALNITVAGAESEQRCQGATRVPARPQKQPPPDQSTDCCSRRRAVRPEAHDHGRRGPALPIARASRRLGPQTRLARKPRTSDPTASPDGMPGSEVAHPAQGREVAHTGRDAPRNRRAGLDERTALPVQAPIPAASPAWLLCLVDGQCRSGDLRLARGAGPARTSHQRPASASSGDDSMSASPA